MRIGIASVVYNGVVEDQFKD